MIKKHLYMWIWGIIVIIIFVLLTFLGFKYKKIIPYKKIENKMIIVAKNIEYKSSDNINKISLKNIKKESTILKNDKKLKNCTGYVYIKKSLILHKKNYKAYLNCPNYKTNIFL